MAVAPQITGRIGVPAIQQLPANDNRKQTTPSRESLRLAIMLVWWEQQLKQLMQAQPGERSAYWRIDLDEAQARVTTMRKRIPADELDPARAWALASGDQNK